ncbi:MAG TPA: O-antigen ligase family protein [Chthoniobacterales bacterium]|jgi:O-antigen ligase
MQRLLSPVPQVAKATAPGSATNRWSDFAGVILLGLALALIQVLIGGTRLLYSLPAYGLLAVIAFLSLITLKRTRPSPDQLCLVSTLVFLGYIVVRALLSPVDYLARPDIYSVLGGLLVYLLVACVFTGPKTRIYLIYFLLVVAMVHVAIGVVQFRHDDNFMLIPGLKRFDYARRASGFYVCPNHLAGLLEVLGVFTLSIVGWSRYPLWTKLLLGYVAAVCYFGLILTGSRGGYLSTVASLVAFGALSLWLSHRSGGTGLVWRVGALGAVAAIIVAIVVTFSVGKSDFLTGRAQNIFETKNMRVDLWPAAIAQWKLAPVFGTGSGTYLYYGRMFRSEKVQVDPVRAHNDYLDLLAEYGVVGAVTFLIFLAFHFRAGWKNITRLAPTHVEISRRLSSNTMALQIAAIAAVVAYVVHSVFDFNLHIPANVLLMAFVFGVLANPGNQRNDRADRLTRGSVWFWRLLPCLIGVVIVIQCVRFLPGEYFAERARRELHREHAGTTVQFAERALETEKNNPNLYDSLGQAQLMRGEARSKPEDRVWFYMTAVEAFQEGRKLAPMDEDFALQLGYTYDKLGRFEKAESMFDAALALDPKSIWAKHFYEEHLKRWREGVPGTP